MLQVMGRHPEHVLALNVAFGAIVFSDAFEQRVVTLREEQLKLVVLLESDFAEGQALRGVFKCLFLVVAIESREIFRISVFLELDGVNIDLASLGNVSLAKLAPGLVRGVCKRFFLILTVVTIGSPEIFRISVFLELNSVNVKLASLGNVPLVKLAPQLVLGILDVLLEEVDLLNDVMALTADLVLPVQLIQIIQSWDELSDLVGERSVSGERC